MRGNKRVQPASQNSFGLHTHKPQGAYSAFYLGVGVRHCIALKLTAHLECSDVGGILEYLDKGGGGGISPLLLFATEISSPFQSV